MQSTLVKHNSVYFDEKLKLCTAVNTSPAGVSSFLLGTHLPRIQPEGGADLPYAQLLEA